MIELKNLQKHLDTLTPKDWSALFELIPQIDRSQAFGDLIESEKLENGSITFPYWSENEIVSRTISAIYKLNVVPVFDWKTWKEGSEIINDVNFDYSSLDTTSLCKLITIIIRRDRFHDGYMVSCFESGTVLKIINSLKNTIVRSND